MALDARHRGRPFEVDKALSKMLQSPLDHYNNGDGWF